MNNGEVKEFILAKLREYSAIPALTGDETFFYAHLKKGFVVRPGQEWREVYKDDKIYYAAVSGATGSKYIFTAHMDRVPDRNGKPMNSAIKNDGDFLCGQLDNLIAIVILRYINEFVCPVNFMLTTSEEPANNYLQLKELQKLTGFVPVSIDIDPYRDDEDFSDGHITIRWESCGKEYFAAHVQKLQFIASAKGIPFRTDLGWSGDEVHFLLRNTDSLFGGAHVGIPLLKYHSENEIIRWESVLNVIKLAQSLDQYENDYENFKYADEEAQRMYDENIRLINYSSRCRCGAETTVKNLHDTFRCKGCREYRALSDIAKNMIIHDEMRRRKYFKRFKNGVAK